MRVPKNVKRVKRNQVVVFDEHIEINGVKTNAIVVNDNGLIMLDTDWYHTTEKINFFGANEK